MRSDAIARLLALLIAGLVAALTIRFNSFANWATDSGAYIAAGHAWARADLFSPMTFVFWAPWTDNAFVEIPYGHTYGPLKGTMTGVYPLGYPLLIAAAVKMGGGLAAHVVAPLTAALLAATAYAVGRALAGPLAGLGAALLIAVTPVTLYHAILAFSDVPATAFWALTWWMTLRRGIGAASAAGAATAMAVMIRPNLAPLALPLAATLAVSEWTSVARVIARLGVYGAVAALGPIMVLWSQHELYGDPFQSGYRIPMSDFFSPDRIATNAWLYIETLTDLHSPWVFAGVLMLPLAFARRTPAAASTQPRLVAASAIGILLVNYALYLPYVTYRGWFWLRFLLPAMLALFVLLAGAVATLPTLLRGRWRLAGLLAMAPLLVVVATPRALLTAPVGYQRIQQMGPYLDAALPDSAVILTSTHGSALALATGRPLIKLEAITPQSLDVIIRDLFRRRYRPVFVLDSAIEGGAFAEKFAISPWSRLTWPARAELSSGQSVLYYDLSDRDRFANGERWATDVLVGPPSIRATVPWTDLRTENERILFPSVDETSSFRSALEMAYQRALGRAPQPSRVNPAELTLWTRRYLRYRLHGCAHEASVATLQAQLNGAAPARLCTRPDDVLWPPRSETVSFVRDFAPTLEAASARTWSTAVDLEGEGVWLQEYLRLRLDKCAHGEATSVVIAQITGATAATRCGPN